MSELPSSDLRNVPSYRLAFEAVQQTARFYLPVLKLSWRRLLPLFLVQAAASQFFEYATDYLRQTGREDVAFIASIAGFELVFTMLWGAAWILAVATFAQIVVTGRAPRAVSLRAVLIRHFNLLVVEQVRSLASVLWRIPLLILPALVEYVRLSFVPLVVLLDPAYNRGEVDVLKESRRLSRHHFWLLTFTVAATFFLPWLLEEIAQGEGGSWVWVNPTRVVIGWVLTLFINLGTSLFLFFVFRGRYSRPPQSHEGWSDEPFPVFSMDGH